MAHRAEGLNDIFEHSILVREDVDTTGGTIQDTPTDPKDIVNKEYVDNNIFSGKHSDLTELDYASAGHTGFEPTVTKGNLTAGSSKVSVGGSGTGAVIGSGASIDVVPGNINTSTLNNDAGFITNLTTFDTDDLNEGSVNLYYTEARVSANSSVVANTAKVTESTTVSAPLTLTGVNVAIPAATTTVNGYLTSTDWNTFNSKEPAVTKQNVTAASNKITLAGTPTGATFQPFSIDVNQANVDHNALLNYSVNRHIDWTNASSNFATTGSVTITNNDLKLSYDYAVQWGGNDCLWLDSQGNQSLGSLAMRGGSLNNALNNWAGGGGALFNIRDGTYNWAGGDNVLLNCRDGNYNSGMGFNAGNAIVDGDGNVLLGKDAGPTADQSNKLYINNAQSDTPLIFGDFTNQFVTINGDLKSPDDWDHFFATANEVSIGWVTATNEWIFNLDVNGSSSGSDLVIDSGDDAYTLRLKNSAKVYQLEYKAWSELEPDETGWGSISAPTKVYWINDGLGSVGITGAVFIQDQDSHLFGSTKLSGQYEENTDIIPMVNWSPLDNGNANVVWELEYTAQIPGLAFPLTTVQKITVPTGGIQYLHNEDAFAAIPGNLIRYVIDFRLSRLGTDLEDDYDNGVVLHGLAFYNSVDTIGSRTQLAK